MGIFRRSYRNHGNSEHGDSSAEQWVRKCIQSEQRFPSQYIPEGKNNLALQLNVKDTNPDTGEVYEMEVLFYLN